MTRAATILLAAWIAPGFSQDAELSDDEQANLTEMINTFSRCAGVYEVTAEFYKAAGQPATAEHVHNLANGAGSAAMYLLGQESLAKGKPPRPYGEFMLYVESLKETAMVAMRSMLELGGTDEFLAEFQTCATLAEAQETVLQKMRDEINQR